MSNEDRLGHIVTQSDIDAALEIKDGLRHLLNRIGALDEKWKKRAAQFRRKGAPHAAAVMDDCVRDLRKAFLEGHSGTGASNEK